MNAVDYLLDNGAPDTDIALLSAGRSHSYGELRDATTAVARYLLAADAQKGDRVMLLAENSFFAVVAYLGSMLAGCTCVPLPPTMEVDILASIIHSVAPKFLFAHTDAATRVGGLKGQMHVLTDDAVRGGNGAALPISHLLKRQPSSTIQPPAIHEEKDLAALMFTSGSTAIPRGVMVSHRNIIANTSSIISYTRLTPRDRVMVVLPFHYCFGASLLHTHLRAGGSLVIDNRFMYPNKILMAMQDTNCTGFAGVPTHYQILLRNSSFTHMHFPSLRWMQQAGGSLPVQLLSQLRKQLANVKIFVMYGQTEATARLSYLPPELLDRKAGSIGRGIPGVRLQVVDERNRPIVPGGTGEIVAEGDNITLGYWQEEHDTRRTFCEGRLYTGDIATVDEDGFIYIVDRMKHFIKCGGVRVSCRHLEEIILECTEIVEAAVVGIPDSLLGEAVALFVVPRRDGPDIVSQLHRLCRERLGPTLLPKKIFVLRSLPKNGSEKVLKHTLQAIAGVESINGPQRVDRSAA